MSAALGVEGNGPAVVGGLVIAALGLGLFGWGAWRAVLPIRSAGLVLVLLGFFVAFTSVLWSLGDGNPGLSTGVFLGAVAVFRLMGSFEPPPPAPPGPGGPPAPPA